MRTCMRGVPLEAPCSAQLLPPIGRHGVRGVCACVLLVLGGLPLHGYYMQSCLWSGVPNPIIQVLSTRNLDHYTGCPTNTHTHTYRCSTSTWPEDRTTHLGDARTQTYSPAQSEPCILPQLIEPGHGRRRHFCTPLCIPFVILHAKQTGGRENDFATLVWSGLA
jgi:hypothetical protein